LARIDLLRAKSIRELDAERLIAVLRRARRVRPDVKVTASRDPDDNKFLEAALAGRADYVVTGDKDLRDLEEHEGVKIRFPEEFLEESGDAQ
jgi:predicted nucleic acid-binding protein